MAQTKRYDGRSGLVSIPLDAVAQNAVVELELHPTAAGMAIAQVQDSTGFVVSPASGVCSVQVVDNKVIYKNLAAAAFTGTLVAFQIS